MPGGGRLLLPWKQGCFVGGNGVGPCLFELEVGPILLTLLAEALGARGEEGRATSPTGPDVARTLWKISFKMLSTFWLGAG